MSLIQRITTRRIEDVINQGYRFSAVGAVGLVTDSVVWAAAVERTVVITGFVVSTIAAADVLVTLSFKSGASASVPFFSGYINNSIVYTFSMGDERYSNIGDALVITTNAAGPTVYTVNGRIIGEKVGLGYAQVEGAGHSGAPGFPPETFSGFSGLWRGGWPG